MRIFIFQNQDFRLRNKLQLASGLVDRRAAFSLIEVSLAMGVAAFCLIAVLGLLPTGVNSDQQSLEQTAAAGIVNSVVADLRATPLNQKNSARFGLPLPQTQDSKTSIRTQQVITANSYALPVINTIYLDQNGTPTGSINQTAGAKSRYRVGIFYTYPKTSVPITNPPYPIQSITVRVVVTWPALADADPNAAKVPMNFSGSYEVVTTLDGD